MSRDERRREAHAFIAERIANANPKEARAIENAMRREGKIKDGEKIFVDGRVNSESAHKIAAEIGRTEDAKE